MGRIPDAFRLTLSVQGRFAGEQFWDFRSKSGILTAEVTTQFAGVLPRIQRIQVSHMNAQTLSSLHYHEGEEGIRPSFETLFDQAQGLVCLRQGREEARIAMTTDYHDPVSLLLWLRTLEGRPLSKSRLTGGTVYIQHLGVQPIDDVPCDVYLLRPGHAYVYVEAEHPKRLMRLVQPCDFGTLEAQLEYRSLRKNTGKERRRARG